MKVNREVGDVEDGVVSLHVERESAREEMGGGGVI